MDGREVVVTKWYFFRKRKKSFSDPQRWVFVRKAHWDKWKKIEDRWLSKETDLFGEIDLSPVPEGFVEVAPSVFESESSLRLSEERLKGLGFQFKGVVGE